MAVEHNHNRDGGATPTIDHPCLLPPKAARSHENPQASETSPGDPERFVAIHPMGPRREAPFVTHVFLRMLAGLRAPDSSVGAEELTAPMQVAAQRRPVWASPKPCAMGNGCTYWFPSQKTIGIRRKRPA